MPFQWNTLSTPLLLFLKFYPPCLMLWCAFITCPLRFVVALSFLFIKEAIKTLLTLAAIEGSRYRPTSPSFSSEFCFKYFTQDSSRLSIICKEVSVQVLVRLILHLFYLRPSLKTSPISYLHTWRFWTCVRHCLARRLILQALSLWGSREYLVCSLPLVQLPVCIGPMGWQGFAVPCYCSGS